MAFGCLHFSALAWPKTKSGQNYYL